MKFNDHSWQRRFADYLSSKDIDPDAVPKHVYEWLDTNVYQPLFTKSKLLVTEKNEGEIKHRKLLNIIDELTTANAQLENQLQRAVQIRDGRNIPVCTGELDPASGGEFLPANGEQQPQNY